MNDEFRTGFRKLELFESILRFRTGVNEMRRVVGEDLCTFRSHRIGEKLCSLLLSLRSDDQSARRMICERR